MSDKLIFLGFISSFLLMLSPQLLAYGEVTPFLSITTVKDDNVYRLDGLLDEESLSDDVSKSDTVFQTTVGLNLNWKVGRQEFVVDSYMVDNRFDRNSQLDYLGQSIQGRWNLGVGNNIKGSVVAGHEVTLSDFANTDVQTKSERTQDRINAIGNWRYHPDWQIGLGLNVYKSTYDTPERAVSDREQLATSLNWDYLANSGSRIGLKYEVLTGDFPNREITESSFIDNEFDQNSVLATVLWEVSGKSRFESEFGLVSRRHPVISSRDYEGVNALLKYNWYPTSKLLVSIEGYRKVLSSDDLLASYSENTGLKLSSVWAVSSKTRVDVKANTETRDYSGQTGVIEGLDSTLEETYNNYSVGLSYEPHQNLNLGVNYNKSDRASSRILRDYNSDMFTLKLTINL